MAKAQRSYNDYDPSTYGTNPKRNNERLNQYNKNPRLI